MTSITLSDAQLEQAFAIAQYDIHAAARYCKVIDARNQMKCPYCGADLVKGGGHELNFICSRYRTPRHSQKVSE